MVAVAAANGLRIGCLFGPSPELFLFFFIWFFMVAMPWVTYPAGFSFSCSHTHTIVVCHCLIKYTLFENMDLYQPSLH